MYKSLILVQLCVIGTIVSSVNGLGFWDGLVNVDRSDNGDRKVGVHLPFIYWMDLNRNKQGPKLDISVLGGLVKVNVDREKDLGGNKRPVMVRFMGQKIYNSYPQGTGPGLGLLSSLVSDPISQGQATNEASTVLKPTDNDYQNTAQEENKKLSDKLIAHRSITTKSSEPSALDNEITTSTNVSAQK